MANNLYTLGATTQAAAKSASRFIRDGVRNGGYVGLVEQSNPYSYNYPSTDTTDYPPIAIASGDVSSISEVSLQDIVTGKKIENVPTLYPLLSLNPVESNGKFLVFYGTTGFVVRIQEQ